jgi:hypothetical protein
VTPLQLLPVPTPRQLARYESIVGAKDAHVLAAALGAQTPYLLTLDRELAERINGANLGVQAFSPGDFIKTILPQHVDYRSLRS